MSFGAESRLGEAVIRVHREGPLPSPSSFAGRVCTLWHFLNEDNWITLWIFVSSQEQISFTLWWHLPACVRGWQWALVNSFSSNSIGSKNKNRLSGAVAWLAGPLTGCLKLECESRPALQDPWSKKPVTSRACGSVTALCALTVGRSFTERRCLVCSRWLMYLLCFFFLIYLFQLHKHSGC